MSAHIIAEQITDMEALKISAETARETVQKIACGLMADMAERGIVGAALRDVHSEMDGCITGMFDAVDIAIASQIEGLEAARKEERRVA